MDLSSEYADLFKDESLLRALKELDTVPLDEVLPVNETKPEIPIEEPKLKTPSLSINSTRYDSDSSSLVLSDETFNKSSKQWKCYQRRFDLHISKTLNPLVRYLLDTPIFVGNNAVYFTKKKAYLEYLVNETVNSYKQQWKEVYLPLCYGSVDQTTEVPEMYRASPSEEFPKEYEKLFRELSLADGDVLTRYSNSAEKDELQPDINKEELLNDVFVETGYRHEFVDMLYKNGIEFFYHLLDFLLILLENTKYKYKIVQTLDLLITMVRIMPELSVLFVVPKNQDSKILNEKKCYFKLLVETIKNRLDLNKGDVLDVYKGCLKGTFVPFYMANPYEHENTNLNNQKSSNSSYQNNNNMNFQNNTNSSYQNSSNTSFQNNTNLNYQNSPSSSYQNLDNNSEYQKSYSPKYDFKDRVDLDVTDLGLNGFQMDDRNELVIVYVLDRLLNLVLLISEKLFEFVLMNVSDETKQNLLKKMKKYLYLPFFGIISLHELFPFFSGKFEYSEVRNLDYRNMLKKYFYPPPPLYSLRLRMLEILELVSSSELVDYEGKFTSANRRLTQYEPVSGMSQKVDMVLVNYLHLFGFGASFLLMGEFMKKSCETIGTFFGNYLFLMPHFKINFSRINEALVIEENVYLLQKSAMNFLLNLNDSNIFSSESYMSIKTVNLIQNNILKRVFSLITHYVENTTESEIEDAENDFNIDNEFNIRNRLVIYCNQYCELIVPYDVNTIVNYLLNNPHKKELLNSNIKEDLFIYNDNAKFMSETVDVCNFEEFDKIARYGLNPDTYYIPLDNRKEYKSALELKPYVQFKTHYLHGTNGSSRGPGRPRNLYMKPINPPLDFVIGNEEHNNNLETASTTDRTVEEEGVYNGCDESSTNREDMVCIDTGSREKCGIICLINKHMVEENRFKKVFELRKEVVTLCMDVLDCNRKCYLGDLKPMYLTFMNKLMS